MGHIPVEVDVQKFGMSCEALYEKPKEIWQGDWNKISFWKMES